MHELKVEKMKCAHCVSVITRALAAVDAAAAVAVDLPLKRVRIKSARPREELLAALARVGYPATPADG